MKLQQLIVDAKSVSDRRQNVVVAKSKNIKQELIEQTTQWSTVGSELLNEQGSTVFYFRSRAGTGLIGRSYPGSLNNREHAKVNTLIGPSDQSHLPHSTLSVLSFVVPSGAERSPTAKDDTKPLAHNPRNVHVGLHPANDSTRVSAAALS